MMMNSKDFILVVNRCPGTAPLNREPLRFEKL